MATKNKGLKTVTFKITEAHKAAIVAACEIESKKIGREYTMAEYFRDSALQFAGKLFKIEPHEYTRGRPLAVKAA